MHSGARRPFIKRTLSKPEAEMQARYWQGWWVLVGVLVLASGCSGDDPSTSREGDAGFDAPGDAPLAERDVVEPPADARDASIDAADAANGAPDSEAGLADLEQPEREASG